MNSKTKGEELNRLNSIFAKMMKAQMFKQLENPTETLEQSTNLEQVLLGQVKDIHYAAKKHDTWIRKPTIGTVTVDLISLQLPIPPFDDLRPEDRLELSAIASAPNQVLSGKYLICQTISTSISVVGLKVVVTDPKGTNAMLLTLYNYSSAEETVLGLDFDDILPPGSFLVLHNPRFILTGGGFVLRCGNPAEIELVSRKRLNAKFPDLGWNGEVEKMTIQFFEKRHFWREFEEDEAVFSKLKGLGNKGFVSKRFSDAIRFYDMALDYCGENREDEAMIQSNKCASLLALGCFNSALKCAEFALEVDPESEKYNYRKTKALIGLGKYEEGMNFLEEKFSQFSSLGKSKDCKTLLENVKFLCSRKNLGPTDCQLISIGKKTLSMDENIPEYFGPLAEVSQIGDKGRGLIATEDIRPGQLLICTKAFCYQAYHSLPSSSNHGNNYERPFGDKMVGKIANKLAFDPELGLEFYNLTAGAELGHLKSEDWKAHHVDMARIAEILKINSFRSGDGMISMPNEHVGLWISPSLLNHSCSEHNCAQTICEGWLTVRAIAEVKKGEEVMLPYVLPVSDYETRQRVCNSHGFTCSCKLCQLDASEPISVRNEREKILKSLDQLSPNCGLGEIKKALKDVEKLANFRKNNVALNYPLLTPQIFRLEDILIKKRRFGDINTLLSRMYEAATASTCWHNEGLKAATSLVYCNVGRGDKEMAKFWVATVKQIVVKLYGSLEASGMDFGQLGTIWN